MEVRPSSILYSYVIHMVGSGFKTLGWYFSRLVHLAFGSFVCAAYNNILNLGAMIIYCIRISTLGRVKCIIFVWVYCLIFIEFLAL